VTVGNAVKTHQLTDGGECGLGLGGTEIITGGIDKKVKRK